MEYLSSYLLSILTEGLLVGALFWGITYIMLESSSLTGALRAGLLSEAVGNIPYLFGIPGISPPGLAMTLLGAVLFIHLIRGVGELTLGRATLGLSMTYFALVAVVSCAPTT